MEFREHNVEYGYTYDSTAVVDRGGKPCCRRRSTRSGSTNPRPARAVHFRTAWLDTDTGQRISTLDLVHSGRFLLIAGEDGDRWCEAAAEPPGSRWDPPRRRPHRPPRR